MRFAISSLGHDDFGEIRTVNSLHGGLASIGSKIQMHGVISSQPLGNERDLLRVKELSYEPRILVANEEHLYATQHVGPAKGFGKESFSVSSELHELIDEQLHCMDSAPRTYVTHSALGQKDMIHGAGTQRRVVETYGNA